MNEQKRAQLRAEAQKDQVGAMLRDAEVVDKGTIVLKDQKETDEYFAKLNAEADAFAKLPPEEQKRRKIMIDQVRQVIETMSPEEALEFIKQSAGLEI